MPFLKYMEDMQGYSVNVPSKQNGIRSDYGLSSSYVIFIANNF